MTKLEREELARERFERLLRFDAGFGAAGLCGIDEAGRGPLAGPVVAAAVVFKSLEPRAKSLEKLVGLDDSKRLSAKRREVLYEAITECCVVGIGVVDAARIDEVNILRATLEAMELAVLEVQNREQRAESQEKTVIDMVIVDGNVVPALPLKTVAVVGADAKSACVAAASVCAKVFRDRLMVQMAEEYPEYGFEKHKGYGTAAHIAAIRRYGACGIHRKSFIGKIVI